MAISNDFREGVKLLSAGSVQMMIGGIVAAVMPKNVSIIYKTAAYIGSVVVSGFAGSKVDVYIDEKLDKLSESIETIGECRELLKKAKQKKNEETEN